MIHYSKVNGRAFAESDRPRLCFPLRRRNDETGSSQALAWEFDAGSSSLPSREALELGNQRKSSVAVATHC